MKRLIKNITSLTLLVICVISSVYIGKETRNTISSSDGSGPIFRVDTDEQVVALTFDINWAEEEYLYRILEILDKYNVKATFFVMGKWVTDSEENTEKLRKIKEGGHELGNHSYVHPSFTKIGDDRINEEVQKTEKIVEEVTGDKMKLFRFPSGDYNEHALDVVNKLGYICIQWDADSVDWKNSGADIEYNRVMKKVKPGSIMLFHNNAKYTPENLERIIKELHKDGYEFKTVGEMLYKEDFYIEKDGEQRKRK